MIQTLRRIALAAALGTLAAGCVTDAESFSYISAGYVTLKPQVVTIGCNDPYEIYDRREGRRMLVVSNALREVTGCGLDGIDPTASRRLRFRAAAETFLRETRREACRLEGEAVFTALMTEFPYTCPGPVDAPDARAILLPGRTARGTR